MASRGSGHLRPPRPPLQARRIRAIAISFPILVVTGYALIDRLVNQKSALPLPGRNPNEGSKTTSSSSEFESS
ncbi:hypothetical protein C8R44DRAFT_886550 [Mycena epipterygia]|nr:hypothetical protein C8R44DRAFT_886550 [Mycena epipterygia]